MSSEVQAFYKEKTILITGGTGFVGKVSIEKLLRTTEVKRIYTLIRSKRGQNVTERLSAWKKDTVFKRLLEEKPNALERVKAITGDCQLPDLGLSDTDRKLLLDEVQIVIHGAATVRFNEPLHVALAINTRATRLVVQLAKQMSRVEAFVHVSTAYSNCVSPNIEERFYPEHLTSSVDEVLKLSEQLSDEFLDDLAPTLLGKYPNTYTYTKALAEQVVLEEASDLPVCIVRPGMIIAANKEPASGWIDNLYGPISLIYGISYGVVRCIVLNLKAQAAVVPVDHTVNAVLASAWQTAITPPKNSAPPIYNFTPSEKNLLLFKDFVNMAFSHGFNYPLTKMIWYPMLRTTTFPWLFNLIAFFYHTLPGYLMDVGLRLQGRKPRLMKIYRKLHENMSLFEYFATKAWTFDTHNTKRLWKCMTTKDQQLFNFDMEHLDWNDYFHGALLGMRQYLCNEPPTAKSIALGLKSLTR
ncbi:fatty acyl-CoA reductase wat-like [Drosophila tropicalis]|uniref:fatty acyl-CoA reductase wat-like n=1 Tax=Drosophila tropicalis TaxID=46794 RepID=UPI0035ABB7E3